MFRVNVPLSYVCSGFGGGDLNIYILKIFSLLALKISFFVF